jgi:WS/DGAT C-terminal domain
VEEKKADPAAGATPALAEVLAVLGRQLVTWMGEVTFGVVDFIVTNVPGILATRYLAGTEILAAYPFAPVARKSPASIALYGYRDRLFIGIDADDAGQAVTALTDPSPSYRASPVTILSRANAIGAASSAATL